MIIFVLFHNPKDVDINIEPKYDRLLEQTRLPLNSHSKSVYTGDIIKYLGEDILSGDVSVVEEIPEIVQLTEKEKKFFLYQIMEESFEENLEETHSSARNYTKDIKRICSYYPFTCNVVSVDSKFTTKDNLYYLAISTYLFEYVGESLPSLYDKLYYIKIQENPIGRRGYAGHYSIIINLKEKIKYKEFFEVLNHELGHIIDLGLIQGESKDKDFIYTEFGKPNFSKDDSSIDFYKISWESEKIRKTSQSSKDFVSGYALTDPFEDFAETYNMYVNHNKIFQKMAKESIYLDMKYKFVEKYLEGKYIKKGNYDEYKYQYRPWDSTRMN